MDEERKIITTQNYRSGEYAWEATRDEWDLGDCIGHGATEAAAIADLLAMEELKR